MTRKVSDTRGGALSGHAEEGSRAAATAAQVAGSAGRAAGALGSRLRPYWVPLVALVGLVVVAVVTLQMFGGTIPIVGSGGAGDPGSTDGTTILTPERTPSPSAPPVVNKDISVAGSLVYVKAGNLWIQSGTEAKKLTTTGRDSQPAWSADGKWIYFIETRATRAKFPQRETGNPSWYDLRYPILSRIHPDGTGREAILSGLYNAGGSQRWFYFINTPAVSPDGGSVAVGSDGPDPTNSNVVLQVVNVARKRMTNLHLPQAGILGHQDPAWSPDGKTLLYVMNQLNDGPQVYRYTPATKKASPFAQGGYTQPTYSADGRWVAAVKSNTIGTNVVVLDARNGSELLRVTSDGRSWGPAFSPDGTQLVFLTLAPSGLTVDVHIANLKRDANNVPEVAGDLQALTTSSGLDGDSRPAWWGPVAAPASTPSAAPDASATPATSATPGPSASPSSLP